MLVQAHACWGMLTQPLKTSGSLALQSTRRRCKFVEYSEYIPSVQVHEYSLVNQFHNYPCHFRWHPYCCESRAGNRTSRRRSRRDITDAPVACFFCHLSKNKEVQQFDVQMHKSIFPGGSLGPHSTRWRMLFSRVDWHGMIATSLPNVGQKLRVCIVLQKSTGCVRQSSGHGAHYSEVNWASSCVCVERVYGER